MERDDMILSRLRNAEADLREAEAVHDYWLTQAEGARLVRPRRGYRLVADGQGDFTEVPIPSSDPQAGR